MSEQPYRAIEDYAVIGDCHGAALVASDGAIDWCCLGRFDEDPVFCRLLDSRRGGYLELRPTDVREVRRAYVPGTNILRTRFVTAGGELEVTDFMPVGRSEDAGVHDYVHLAAPGCLVRLVECAAGSVEVQAEYSPSVRFGSEPPPLAIEHEAVRMGAGQPVLWSDVSFTVAGCAAAGSARLAAGERRYIAVGGAGRLDASRVRCLYDVSAAFWKEWIGYCRYRGPYQAAVERSALVLKLMTYAPSGGIVAAVTTSLPEEMGGSRNWDYRYCYGLPDMGLWETRTAPRHYVHSKITCWVVVDRAIRLLGERSDWASLERRMWEDIVAQGRSPAGHLVQAYDSAADGATDAALLQVALMDTPADARTLRATREAVERQLRRGDFVERYATEDGMHGEGGAFFVCSFWLVDALLAEGRHDEAERLFERLLAHGNDVGLYSEQADIESGAFLGNFPQAFTHFGLVGAAVNLELSRSGGSGAVRGTYADRARRCVGATFGWRGVWTAFLHSGCLRVFSSRVSKPRRR